jgi:predicted HNH restriction endonuclease
VKRLIGADPYSDAWMKKRIPRSGTGLAIKFVKIKDVDFPFREDFFPRLGWYRFSASSVDPTLLDSSDLYEEGAKHYRNHLVTERSAALRTKAKNYWRKKYGRLICLVCRFDFAVRYGSHGDDFIEMHHEVPVSGGIRKNSVEALVPLCSNCHRMIHRNPHEMLTTDGLRRILRLERD